MRNLEDNTLFVAGHRGIAGLRVDSIAFLRGGSLGNRLGGRVCATLPAAVELHGAAAQPCRPRYYRPEGFPA